MKRRFLLPALLALLVMLAACGTTDDRSAAAADSGRESADGETTGEETTDMQMKIGETPVSVTWEDNDAAEALRALCADGPLEIQLRMYGGFEQVGDIGASLPRDDAQTTTRAGDIVLYAGDQIVVFYGSNSWAYTRLGHITDQTADGMRGLLGNGDVTITLTAG